jgi:hypothetical protein
MKLDRLWWKAVTLSGEGAELNGEVSRWSGPMVKVEQSATHILSANCVVEDLSQLNSEG